MYVNIYLMYMIMFSAKWVFCLEIVISNSERDCSYSLVLEAISMTTLIRLTRLHYLFSLALMPFLLHACNVDKSCTPENGHCDIGPSCHSYIAKIFNIQKTCIQNQLYHKNPFFCFLIRCNSVPHQPLWSLWYQCKRPLHLLLTNSSGPIQACL